VPQGASGELYVGGAGLAQGYHQQPGMTAERFVADPFAAHGGRLYRTGDLVRQRADGQVEYLGRIDHQVKIRGFRIELGEIETRLLEHPDVREAVVLALDSPSGKQLVAYLVSDAEHGPLREALKTHLKAQLPDYMLPAHVLVLDSMPLTANGKLDRRALPAPDPEANRQHYVAPRNALEQTLAAIWCAVLNVQQVGLDDNFFELGGDSILSIQVVSRARQAGIHFSPREVFQHQTVQSLAAVATCAEQVTAEQGVLTGRSGLTPIQRWFFDSEIPARQHWNQALVLKPLLLLDPHRLEQALLAVLEHHDALRLSFTRRDAQWHAEHLAVPQGGVLMQAHVRDLQQCSALFSDTQRSLDLAHGPLLRALLVDGPQGQQRLLIVIHHLVVDGVSWRVLLEDLQNVYRQLSDGQSVSLPAKTSALRDWAARLQAYAGSESLREELTLWQDQLAGPVLALPVARPHGGLRHRDAETLSVRLDAEHTRQLLQQAPGAYRTQVNDLLLTALARVLCRCSGHASALIQLEGHGRETLFDEIDLTRSVGWFTSAYPVRLTPLAEQGASIKAIKEQLRGVPHKGLGYGVLRYLADDLCQQTLAALPSADVTFNYLGQFDQAFAGQQLFRVAPESSGRRRSPHTPRDGWFVVNAVVYDGALRVDWEYSRALHDRGEVERLVTDYLDELRAVVAHCEAVLGDPS